MVAAMTGSRPDATAATTAAVLVVTLIAVAFWRTPAAWTASGGWVVWSALLTLAGLACGVVLVWVGPLSTMDIRAQRIGTLIGLVLGTVLVVEGVAEILSPTVSAANIPLGYAVVGVLVVSFAVAGALAGTWAALRTALVGYLVWYPTIWITYLIGDGSAAFDRVLRAEGDYDDFARSGFTDFHAFLVRDFLGAGFYHLVFAVALALAFGRTGAALADLLRGRRDHAPPPA
jgi:hypothetical protein